MIERGKQNVKSSAGKCIKCKDEIRGLSYTWYLYVMGVHNISPLCRNCYIKIYSFMMPSSLIPDHIPRKQHKQYLLQKQL